MASSNKKKIEEENNLKTLREIVALGHNKHCFDCNQRGPTYVNMTIGSFVCTACSGLLRGLNPPHRVKSISMASFSNDEMEFIKCRGNEFCHKVWLGMYDRKTPMEIDSKDEGKMKEIMSQRYEKKRWYVHPPESLFEESRKQNTAGKQVAASKPLSSLVAGLPISATAPSYLQRAQVNRPNSEPSHPSVPAQSPGGTKTEQPPPKKQIDILADFASDPFATPARTSATQQPSEGFADFSAFNAFPQQNQNLFTQPAWPQQMPAFSVSSNRILLPNPGFNSAASNQATVSSMPQMSDKYSALTGLDGESSVFGSSSVDWDGKKSVGWTPGASATSFGQANPPLPLPPPYSSLNFASTPNPFGMLASNQMPVGHQGVVPNPFASNQQLGIPAYFSHAGAFPSVPQMHSSFVTPNTSLSSGQFGVFPTGGLPAVPLAAGGTARPAGVVSNGTIQPWGLPTSQSHIPASWGTQPSHNPFLGTTGNTADSLGSKNPHNPFL